ncbi:hypothetical protein RFI_37967 [Reticulomyxa filosa]|nr:hypothetical protein RFI_37967 [Reticulomyxa filosa]|eukprot:ETN99504.1 hypothetical protein RFI_37967 [Reticulomyxa filosa]
MNSRQNMAKLNEIAHTGHDKVTLRDHPLDIDVGQSTTDNEEAESTLLSWTLPVGTPVRIHGLARYTEFNDQMGNICGKFDVDHQVYPVSIHKKETDGDTYTTHHVTVSCQNLQPLYSDFLQSKSVVFYGGDSPSFLMQPTEQNTNK